jgi:hypothetical protein
VRAEPLDRLASRDVTTVGYSGRPLPGKLGITEDSAVLLDGVPPTLVDVLTAQGSVHRRASRGPYDVAVLFCPDAARLRTRWPRVHAATKPGGALWVAWPKRASGIETDLGENTVREYGLTHGRVDVKVAAIDQVWSGLKFVVRLEDR